jgi:tRNA (mo5U34)-methyltransferase
MKIDYRKFLSHLGNTGLKDFAANIAPVLDNYFATLKHGDFAKWLGVINALPPAGDLSIDLNADTVRIGTAADLDAGSQSETIEKLMQLHPWRKGPFKLFGIHIDTEWRSDWKWQRLADHIKPLKGKAVLDIGCGNGYHCLRMLGDGAESVVGIDPFLLFVTQFQLLNKYIQTDKVAVLPFGIDDLPTDSQCFDTVFSMGVLYHRKDPAEHIERMKGFLKPGGEMVLETLIIEDQNTDLLIPEGRYAKMRNVWNIPSPALLKKWVEDAGLKNARIIDITKTTTKEQRSTNWMTFESLSDYLNKEDDALTIEGHPAPKRAIILAQK